ncbi:MAG TPA: hypothetical protein VGM22_04395 [Methylomirabilota bacterium]|jgi:hypothetical protein
MLAERPLAGVAVRCAVLAVVVFLAALPVYVWVEPSWRALVARLAAALVLGIALLQLRAVITERVEAGGRSALDAARFAPGPAPGVPYHVVELTSDVRTALRSRRYFETVLWPRLEALAGRPLVRPARRRGRGPSLAGLRAVIAAIEERP